MDDGGMIDDSIRILDDDDCCDDSIRMYMMPPGTSPYPGHNNNCNQEPPNWNNSLLLSSNHSSHSSSKASQQQQQNLTLRGLVEGQQQRKITVRFPDDPAQLARIVDRLVNREDLTAEDREALWFGPDDYTVLKADARLESLATERDGLGKILANVFDHHHQHGEHKSKSSKEAQEKVNRWVLEGEERRGLERTANPELGNARQQAQFQAIMDVLRAQDELCMMTTRGRNSDGSTEGVDAGELRKVSLKATRAARHFARMIAKADALAVDIEHGTNHSETDPSYYLERRRSSNKISRTKSGDDTATTTTSSNSSKKKSQKEKKSKSKDKSKDKTKDKKDETKNKLTLKQKFKETKAGIISRIPRIA